MPRDPTATPASRLPAFSVLRAGPMLERDDARWNVGDMSTFDAMGSELLRCELVPGEVRHPGTRPTSRLAHVIRAPSRIAWRTHGCTSAAPPSRGFRSDSDQIPLRAQSTWLFSVTPPFDPQHHVTGNNPRHATMNIVVTVLRDEPRG